MRISSLAIAFLLYFSSHWLRMIKKEKYANKSLEKASIFALYALGIIIRNNKILEHLKEDNQIHIANHDNPIDILIIQGIFKMRSITTSHLHLKRIFPNIKYTIYRYGHVLLNYKNNNSRVQSIKKLDKNLKKFGRIFIFPNGSLLTNIQKRFSRSISFLSKQNNAKVYVWKFKYLGDYESLKEFQYDPLKIILKRLGSNPIVVTCQNEGIFDPEKYKSQNEMTISLQNKYKF